MSKKIELTWKDHANLKIDPLAAIKEAQTQHIVSVRVNELVQACSSFPVFFIKISEADDWTLAALTSLQVGHNLYVKNNRWQALYIPTRLQTFPFFLMPSAKEDDAFVVGIEEDHPAFSIDQGEPLFESENTAGSRLSRAALQLQNDARGDLSTRQFRKFLADKNLLQEVAIQVVYKDGVVNLLNGVHIVDDKALANLGNDDFLQLKEQGCLPPLYAHLSSLFQLNRLLIRHNKIFPNNPLLQVGIQPPDQTTE